MTGAIVVGGRMECSRGAFVAFTVQFLGPREKVPGLLLVLVPANMMEQDVSLKRGVDYLIKQLSKNND